MGRSKTMKRRSQGRKLGVPTINSLPTELVTDVLARVAESSVTDLFNAKLTCRFFHALADDKHVFQRASLEKFPVRPWRISRRALEFLDRCEKNGNPEALYRQGVVEYFSHARLEKGLEYLKTAAKSGHLGASYVLVLILACSGVHEFKQQGIHLLSRMTKSKSTSRRVRECRNHFQTTMTGLWIRNHQFLEHKPTCCTMGDCQHKQRQGWPLDESDEEDNLRCDACRCDREISSFCRAVYGRLI